jgi:type IV pilus assembly protein PilA
MINRIRQLGQGMTEYIIIVALIAIAAIAVYGFFGDAIRGQVGAMTQELAGQNANMGTVTGAATSATGEQDQRGLSNYSGK